MRVSNDTLRSAFLAALDDARRRVVETQQQVSTGLRINSPSDDPVAAARVAHLDASLSRLDQYQANAIFARNQLGLEEESLGEAMGDLQRIRELTLQANNGSASSGDRQIIAAKSGSIVMGYWRSRTPPMSTVATCSPVTANRRRLSRWALVALSSTTATKGSARCRSATAASSPSTIPAPTCSNAFQKATARLSWVSALRTPARESSARARHEPCRLGRRHLHRYICHSDDL